MGGRGGQHTAGRGGGAREDEAAGARENGAVALRPAHGRTGQPALGRTGRPAHGRTGRPAHGRTWWRPPSGTLVQNTQAHRRECGSVVSAARFDGRRRRRSSPRKRLNRRRRSDRLDEVRLQIAAIWIQIMRRSHWKCQRIERGMKNRYGVVCAHSSILAGSSSLQIRQQEFSPCI